MELNPVRAGLAVAPSDYRWSSEAAHLKGKDDCLVRVSPLLKIAGNWRRLLVSAVSEELLKEFREHDRTGRVPRRRRFSETTGEEAWSCFEAAETRPENSFKTVIAYAVPGTPELPRQ